MIPKTIHYCWFGKNPKPKLAQKCIKSWKKNCKDYEIIEWNEDNFDISSAPLYVRQAYKAQKWAYVTDYVRLKIIYDNGGIYLDTDVQVIKPLNIFLKYKAYFGFEEIKYVNTGLGFGAEKNLKLIKEIMDQYEDIAFIKEDGSIDNLTCPIRNTEVFKRHGLVQNGETQYLDDDVIVFSSEYFCPISYETLEKTITKNTHSIHWFGASWQSQEEKKEHKYKIKLQKREQRKDCIIHFPNRVFLKLLGEKRYNKVKQRIKK